jgi:hypothetical protein
MTDRARLANLIDITQQLVLLRPSSLAVLERIAMVMLCEVREAETLRQNEAMPTQLVGTTIPEVDGLRLMT